MKRNVNLVEKILHSKFDRSITQTVKKHNILFGLIIIFILFLFVKRSKQNNDI